MSQLMMVSCQKASWTASDVCVLHVLEHNHDGLGCLNISAENTRQYNTIQCNAGKQALPVNHAGNLIWCPCPRSTLMRLWTVHSGHHRFKLALYIALQAALAVDMLPTGTT